VEKYDKGLTKLFLTLRSLETQNMSLATAKARHAFFSWLIKGNTTLPKNIIVKPL
jgi:hypothetical protein